MSEIEDAASEAQKIVELIKLQSKGLDIPKRIFIASQQFVKFIEEVEPLYIKRYGALVIDQKATEEGYDNVLFNGVVVCMDDERCQILKDMEQGNE